MISDDKAAAGSHGSPELCILIELLMFNKV